MKKFFKKIFSLENISGYKVLTFFGKKFKVRRNFGHTRFPKGVKNYVYDGSRPEDIKKLAIVASFNPKGEIADYVVYFLRELSKVCDGIIFIADNPVFVREIDKIKDYVFHAEFKRHGKYDFGSYQIGYEYAQNEGFLSGVQELVLCNDSNFGPVFPLKEVFDKMAGKTDFWGLAQNLDCNYHIQSFFMVFNSKIISENKIGDFLSAIKKEKSLKDVIVKYECELTKYLHRFGYTSDALVPMFVDKEIERKSIINGNRNKTYFPLKLMEKYRFPFVKIKSFTSFYNEVVCCDSPKEIFEGIKGVNAELSDIVDKYLSEHKIKDKIIKKSVYEMVDESEIISFNLFDTLLVRPYYKSEDLYLHMEKLYDIPNFAKARISASKKAAEVFSDENYSIDDIYNLMPSEFIKFKEKELLLEKSVLCRNTENCEIYKYALAKNKKVVIISDTYLPMDFVEDVLKSNDICGYDKLYISKDCKKSKISGELYKQIMCDYDVKANEEGVLLNIGVNNLRDIEIPKRLGISVYKIPKYIDIFKKSKNNKKYQIPYKQNPCIQNSMINSLVVLHQIKTKEADYWQEIGYGLFGPILLSYIQKDSAFDGKDMDAAKIQEAFEKIKSEIPDFKRYFSKDKEFRKGNIMMLIEYLTEDNISDGIREKVIDEIKSGAVLFVRDYLSTYKDYAIEFDSETALMQILCWDKTYSRYDEATILELLKNNLPA